MNKTCYEEIKYLKTVLAEELSIDKKEADLIQFVKNEFVFTLIDSIGEKHERISLEEARGLAAAKALQDELEDREEVQKRLCGFPESIRPDEIPFLPTATEHIQTRENGNIDYTKHEPPPPFWVDDNRGNSYPELIKEDLERFEEKKKNGLIPFGLPELNKESEKNMHEEKMWSLYEVVIVDKEPEEPKIVTPPQNYIVAKTVEMAKGKSGYNERLAEKDYDDTKLELKICSIMNEIKSVEEEDDE